MFDATSVIDNLGLVLLSIAIALLLLVVLNRRIAAQVSRAEIHLSKQRFRALELNASDIIAVVAADGTVDYASTSIQRILGYDPEAWQGKKTSSLVYADDTTKVEQFLTQALAAPNRDVSTELRLQHMNSEIRDFELVARNLLADPAVAGIVITYRDITDRKRKDDALRKSEERYRTFVAQSSEAIWRFELETPIAIATPEDRQIQHFYQYGYLAECNDVMAQMYGFACAADIVGLRLADFLPAAEPANVEYLLNFIRSGYRLVDAETLELDKYGNFKYFLNNLVGIIDDGLLLRAWGNQRDISDRKQVQQALRCSEERYRSLVEATAQIIWNTRFDGEVVSEQPGWSAFTGQTFAELQGWGWLNAVHPEDRELTAQVWSKAISDRSLYQIEHRLRRYDGEYRYMSVRGVPVLEANGSIREWVGVHTDVTEREQLLIASETANRMKDEFLATLSHELRTPLNVISGWITLLRTRSFDQAATNRALETLDRNVKSLTQLIEDVLDVSRIITGKLRLNEHPVELESVIAAAIETVHSAASAKDIQIELMLDSTTALVLGDKHRLQQVVWNLLFNAVKFTPKGGRIEVRLAQVNSHAQIQVSDTGQGIDPEFLPYVFDRFRQADSTTTRSHGGLGLGLAIVRHLVELHGGTVIATSAGVGQGATFTVSLPVIALAEKISSPPLAAASNLDELRILVVDDEPDARELVATILTAHNAQVVTAASATEALEILTRSHFDILLSDIGMPEEDGYWLIEQVRSNHQNIAAVALTAYARLEDQTKARLAGFEMHIAKPIDPDQLVAVVAKLTNNFAKRSPTSHF